jgi:hypothetical protein
VRQRFIESQAGIQVHDDFGITLGMKTGTATGRVRAQPLVIIEFAVFGQHQAFVIGDKGLSTTLFVKVDDGQTRMTEPDTLHGLPAEPIRAAMILYGRHGHQGFRVYAAVTICI